MGSVAAWLVALACVPALNQAGGALAAALALPAGGHARLGWDLAWWALSVATAQWVVARWAPVAARVQAAVFFLAVIALSGWALWTLGGDFPRAFLLAAGLGTPLAMGLGNAVARRGRRR